MVLENGTASCSETSVTVHRYTCNRTAEDTNLPMLPLFNCYIKFMNRKSTHYINLGTVNNVSCLCLVYFQQTACEC